MSSITGEITSLCSPGSTKDSRNIKFRLNDNYAPEKLTPTTLNCDSYSVNGSWIFCQTKPMLHK